MSSFDIRYFVLIVINMAKSQASMPWDWDPFVIIGDLTWMKFWLLFILSVIFSFFSVKVPLACPVNAGYMYVRVGEFSCTLFVLLVASLLLPQVLFWYFFPIVLLVSLCSLWFSNMVKSFVDWAQASLSTLPDLNVFVSTITETDGTNLEQEHMGPGIAGNDPEEEVQLVLGDGSKNKPVGLNFKILELSF
ncbi:hypothetical protein NMG60_11027464 [Bertholletia excelsa]